MAGLVSPEGPVSSPWPGPTARRSSRGPAGVEIRALLSSTPAPPAEQRGDWRGYRDDAQDEFRPGRRAHIGPLNAVRRPAAPPEGFAEVHVPGRPPHPPTPPWGRGATGVDFLKAIRPGPDLLEGLR